MIKKPVSDPPGCTNDIMAMTDALDVLGGKWTLLLLHYLLIRTGRDNTFNKIQKDIEGISPKVLTQQLKVLELNQLIERNTLATKPVSVSYSITEYGKSVKQMMDVLVQWGSNHRLKMFQTSH